MDDDENSLRAGQGEEGVHGLTANSSRGTRRAPTRRAAEATAAPRRAGFPEAPGYVVHVEPCSAQSALGLPEQHLGMSVPCDGVGRLARNLVQAMAVNSSRALRATPSGNPNIITPARSNSPIRHSGPS
jgi:hypothetical protein